MTLACFGMMMAALIASQAPVRAYDAVLGPRKPFQKIDLSALKFPDRHPLVYYTPAEIEQIKRLIAGGDASLPQVRQYQSFKASADKWVVETVTVDPKGSEYLQMRGGLCPKDSASLTHERLPDRTWHHECPRCNTVYEGDVYDSWGRGAENMHFAREVQDLGLAYAFVGDERYAGQAREILLQFAQTYTGMKTPVMEEYLNLFYWSSYLVTGYDLVYESPVFSRQDRALIEGGLFRPLADTILRIAQAEGRNNRGVHAITGAGAIAFLLRDRDMVEFCLNSPDDVNATPPGTFPCGLAYLMENCVDEDGLWIERMGYHWYTVGGLINITEPAYRAGINLYQLPRLRAMFTGPPLLAAPGSGRDRGSRLPLDQYQLIQLRAPDPLFEKILARVDAHNIAVNARTLWMTPNWPANPDEPPLALKSKNFTGWGYAILRSGAAPAENFLSMVWLDHAISGGHAQSQKFGVTYYAGGRSWTSAPGGSYTNPMGDAWARRAVSQNALTVDGLPQKISFGKATAFHAGPRLQLFKAVEDEAYPGVTHERLLMLADGYALDLCRASSDRERQYDLAHRYTGEMTSSLPRQARPGPLGWRAGYEFVDGLWSVRTSESWWADWRQDAEHALRVTVAGGPATEVIGGVAPGSSLMTLVRRYGKQATFVSLLEAYGAQPTITAAESLTAPGDDATAVKVTRTGATDYLLANVGPGVRQHGDLRWDGEFGMVSLADQDAEAQYAQLVNGRRLEGGGWAITSDLPVTLYVERMGNGDYLVSADVTTSGAISLRGRSVANARVKETEGDVAVDATAGADSVRFEVEAGRSYRVTGLSGLREVAVQARPRTAIPSAQAPAAPSGTTETVRPSPASVAPISGKNRARNSSFELTGGRYAGADPWQFGSSYYEKQFQGNYVYDDTVARTGKFSIRLPMETWFNPVTRDSWLLQENVVAEPGASTWTLSAYVRASETTKVRLCLFGNEVQWGENDEGGVSPVIEIGPEWQRVSVTRPFRPGISSVGIIIKREHQSFGGDLWVDDVQLESGPVATEYRPDLWTEAAGR
jgi:hypothetical protein